MKARVMTALGVLALAACGDAPDRSANTTAIEVRSEQQTGLHTLDALNLAIALKRAIYDAGQTCQRVDDAGFVGKYQNLDMWMAKCGARDWAVFAGPDGSAQVRDCKDVESAGLPKCAITRRPAGNIDGSES